MGFFSGIGSALGLGGAGSPPDFTDAIIDNGPDGKPYVKDPAKLWKEVMELRDDALSQRKMHERLWALCWMFYRGDQWRKPSPAPDWNIVRINVGKKPKITINKILPMVQTRRAHCLKNRPTGIVMPRTLTEEDRNSARVAQDILNYDQQHLRNWEILDGKLSLCMFVTGNAFKKVYWDPTKGDKKERNKYKVDQATGAPLMAPMEQAPGLGVTSVPSAPEGGAMDFPGSTGEEEQAESAEATDPQLAPVLDKTVMESEGDVVVEFVSPEEVLPEPAATCIDDCQRLLHRTLKPLKWVKDNYGQAAKDVQPIDVRTERGKSMAQGARLFGMTEREVANRVEVLEAWYRPSEDFPEGLHGVWADDKLLAAGPTPEAHDHIPFVHYIEIDTDEFWGMSSVSQVIDPQKALNLAVSRDEFLRQRLRPKLIAPTDAGIDENAYSNDDAEIVFYHHPFKPDFTQPPEFRRDEEAINFFKASVDDIGGSADIMRGQITGGDVRSGRMVNYLQEYAGTVLSGPARYIERGEEKTGNMILRLRKHYTDEPRIYYIVGRDRDVEAKQFLGSDIEGAADYVVQAGSALPMSMSEKRDMVLSLVEKGVLLPGDPRIIKMMGMPSDIDQMFNEKQIDRDNATEEDHKFLQMNEEAIGQFYDTILKGKMAETQGMAAQIDYKPSPMDILQGMDLEPRDFEDHITHLETHNRSRKSQAYRKLPKSVQALFDEHCDMHAFHLLPPPGTMPGPGGPGGPGDGHKPPDQPDHSQPGGPAAMQGHPPGNGGAGHVNAQGNQERNQGLRPPPAPPGANNHHLL